MSIIGTVLGGVIRGTGYGAIASEVLGGIFGGGENIANKLSKQVGCQIPQAQANQARALMAKGINPCTGQPMAGTYGGNVPLEGIPSTAIPGSSPIPVFDTAPAGPAPVSAPMANRGVGAFEYTTTGLIKNVIVNGRRISRRRAASFIKKAGLDIGAQGLGLTQLQAAQLLMVDMSRPRRRRGLSYRQIANARRVYRTVQSMSKSLSCTTRRAPARRKTSCR